MDLWKGLGRAFEVFVESVGVGLLALTIVIVVLMTIASCEANAQCYGGRCNLPQGGWAPAGVYRIPVEATVVPPTLKPAPLPPAIAVDQPTSAAGPSPQCNGGYYQPVLQPPAVCVPSHQPSAAYHYPRRFWRGRR